MLTSHILTSTWPCIDAGHHAPGHQRLVLAELVAGGYYARGHMLLDLDVSSEELMRSRAAVKVVLCLEAMRVDEARRVSYRGCCRGGGRGACHGDHELEHQDALVAEA